MIVSTGNRLRYLSPIEVRGSAFALNALNALPRADTSGPNILPPIPRAPDPARSTSERPYPPMAIVSQMSYIQGFHR
jgi:hypothetical protein